MINQERWEKFRDVLVKRFNDLNSEEELAILLKQMTLTGVITHKNLEKNGKK